MNRQRLIQQIKYKRRTNFCYQDGLRNKKNIVNLRNSARSAALFEHRKPSTSDLAGQVFTLCSFLSSISEAQRAKYKQYSESAKTERKQDIVNPRS
jgi:hypothetical protein